MKRITTAVALFFSVACSTVFAQTGFFYAWHDSVRATSASSCEDPKNRLGLVLGAGIRPAFTAITTIL